MNMKNSKIVAFTGFFFIVMHADKLAIVNTSPTCSWNQITRLNGSKQTCWDCPKCNEGWGLIPQCSSYVNMDVQIRCEKCKNGISYSDVNDISSCKSCTICGENEVTIRPCNITHNAICGKCKPGFYRAITEDCWPCTKCCPDSTDDEVEFQCLEQGLPAEQSCRMDFKTMACANRPTPRNIQKTTRIGCRNEGNDSGDGRVPTINSTAIVRYHILNNWDKSTWIVINIFISIFICVVVILAVYAFKTFCRHRRCRPPRNVDKILLENFSAAETTPV